MSIEEDLGRYGGELGRIRRRLEKREKQLVKKGRAVEVSKFSGGNKLFDLILNFDPERIALLKEDREYRELCELRDVYLKAGRYLVRRLDNV